MNKASLSNKPPEPSEERAALEKSERDASAKQPGSYKEKATDEKIVAIPPVGKDKKPIRGLDSK